MTKDREKKLYNFGVVMVGAWKSTRLDIIVGVAVVGFEFGQ